MENKRNYSEVEFVKNFLATYTANHGEERANKQKDRMVGNNGYAIGQEFHLTGEIAVNEMKDEKGKVTATYIVLRTKEGVDLSLMSLMGVSSLNGYAKGDEKILNEWKEGNTKKSEEVGNDLIADFDFSRTWKPATRNLLDLAGMIAENEIDLKDSVVTYCGTVVKSITAKKAGELNGEKWEKDYKRVITTRMWYVE